MKNKNIKIGLFIFCLLLFRTMTFAQVSNLSKTTGNIIDEQKDLGEQMISLDSIIDLAIKNSPSVKFQQDLVDAAQSQVNFSKTVWTNNIVGFVNYSGGNQSIVTNGSQSPGSLSSQNVTSGYRVGVQINLPLYEFIGRKSRVNLYKYQLNSTVNKKDESVQELKKEVIRVYYSLLYYSNLLNIRSEAKQSTISQYAIAQKQFKDGVIDLAEMSRLKSIQVNASADYEEAKREFSTLYHQLEPLVGVPFNQLILRK